MDDSFQVFTPPGPQMDKLHSLKFLHSLVRRDIGSSGDDRYLASGLHQARINLLAMSLNTAGDSGKSAGTQDDSGTGVQIGSGRRGRP